MHENQLADASLSPRSPFPALPPERGSAFADTGRSGSALSRAQQSSGSPPSRGCSKNIVVLRTSCFLALIHVVNFCIGFAALSAQCRNLLRGYQQRRIVEPRS